jgi:PTH1 family peptidyl-tRNA hydrolase
VGGVELAPVLVVGLGNPGPQYQFTPHNAGFMAIDRIAERCGVTVSNRRQRSLTGKAKLAGRDVLLAKPETYMNHSGEAVRALLDAMSTEEQAAELIVLYDDVDFALGTLKVKERGSSAGHNGVKSITGSLGTQEWVRVRIGIAPQGEQAANTARLRRLEFVVAPLRKAELALLDEGIDKAADAVEAILTDGVAAAMNRFNQRSAE